MSKEIKAENTNFNILNKLAESSRNGLTELAMGMGFVAGPLLRSHYLLTGVAYPCGESLEAISPFKVMDPVKRTRVTTDMIMDQRGYV